MTKRLLASALTLATAFSGFGTDLTLGGGTRLVYGTDDPLDDLRPGFSLSCRVRFDESPVDKGEMTIVQKGGSNDLGAYILRVDGPKEGVKFSFFVNVDGRPEPRLSLPFGPKKGVWHNVSAGWDGTNAFLCVDGQRVQRVRRPVKDGVLPCEGARRYGPMDGLVRDLTVKGPPIAGLDKVKNASLRPGLRLGCDVTFVSAPSGETTVLCKPNEYWLRYDKTNGKNGAFNFFVFLDGSWEPRTTVPMLVETGRTYRVTAGWSGLASSLGVEGSTGSEPTRRHGRRSCSCAPIAFGSRKIVKVENLAIRSEEKTIVVFGMFRTRELMPRMGEGVTYVGTVENVGLDAGPCRLSISAKNGVRVSPEVIDFANLKEGAPVPVEVRVEPGTNAFAFLDFSVTQGDRKIARATRRIVFMPKEDPDYSAKKWNPPQRPRRTWHIDSIAGNDANDGLSPEKAWKTFRKAASLTLGPGDRLLLKRGSLFDEELSVKAFGSAENWAEIGAYGEGMRPQIRLHRHINERCASISAAYLAVRDLIFCNAGAGLRVSCEDSRDGHILVERCLAHHIEGTYRFNSHGIPEWRDEPGPAGGSRSWGLAVNGRAHHVVMRDCESYQCSSGFTVSGHDTFVNRMFSHDNYAHNTSPHPYNTASRSWITDCVFDASGWHASAGTMGIMLAGNDGWIMRGCHFLNQPDSGSPDQGGIDFECQGENCLVDRCTFRNNAGAAIEVLGLRTPQTRNVEISRCRFDRNNWAFKNGPAEIQVWGGPHSPKDVVCSNGSIHDNGCVLVPGVPFYVNETHTTNAWILSNNREFDFAEDLNAAFPYPDPPKVTACDEVWTDRPVVALSATVDDAGAKVAWEQVEGPAGVTFEKGAAVRTKAHFPVTGDYRVNVAADNGTLWRTARTAVHVLPKGSCTAKAWTFAKNLDSQGWTVEKTGTGYEFLPGKNVFWNSESFPVHLVCGDYYVIAVKESATAAIVTEEDRDVGVEFSARRANALRVKMQNATNSKRMRLWWQTDAAPAWDEKRSVPFEVKPNDREDTLYTVALPKAGGIKQLRLSFSADGEPVTGTVRLDYIWLGRLPQ